MTQITLGLCGAVGYDAAAALYVGNELVAAVEEERLTRRRHAKDAMPFNACRQVLQQAGIKPSQVDVVAIPYAPVSLFSKARWHYAYRHWYAPDRSIDSLFNGNRRYRRYLKQLGELLEKVHIDQRRVTIKPVQHQLAHAASAYLINETDEKTAILCVDSKGEYSNVFLGYGDGGQIHSRIEFYNPDSLCGMYAAITDYLGFDIIDGEFKVMGISAFGDPDRYDLSYLARFDGKKFYVDNSLITTVGLRRYRSRSRSYYFSKKLVEKLGPRRAGSVMDDPYVHYAAAIQKLYEDLSIKLIEAHLSDILEQTGRLAVAGTGSMNIRLNKRLLDHPLVKELIVTPLSGDAGTAAGAAAVVVREGGERLAPTSSMSLGPRYTTRRCIEACRYHREKPQWRELEDPHAEAARLLAEGKVIAWFRGPMEFGPRSLGNRCILANPLHSEAQDAINSQVKFREDWRPYSPSVMDKVADEFFADDCRDEFMCISAPMSESAKARFPGLATADGSTRAQVVTPGTQADFYRLFESFFQQTGEGVLINATLCRPGEALVCTPEDALNMFIGTDLDYLILQDLLVTKREIAGSWGGRGEAVAATVKAS